MEVGLHSNTVTHQSSGMCLCGQEDTEQEITGMTLPAGHRLAWGGGACVTLKEQGGFFRLCAPGQAAYDL